MKYLITILIALFLFAPVVLADSTARFDWSLGQPTVIEDSTGSEYWWSLGQPVVVEKYEAAAAAGTNMKVNIADSWKDVDSMQINIGDAWKDVAGAWINIGDSWKIIY